VAKPSLEPLELLIDPVRVEKPDAAVGFACVTGHPRVHVCPVVTVFLIKSGVKGRKGTEYRK